jgi:hypothetical protein
MISMGFLSQIEPLFILHHIYILISHPTLGLAQMLVFSKQILPTFQKGLN